MKKRIIIVIFAISVGIWWQIFIPKQKTKLDRTEPQSSIQIKEDNNIEQPEIFNKKYQVLHGLDEKVSSSGSTRYIRKILVTLGLSREELTDNLIHAAWELQKEKNATGIIIFALQNR